MKRSLNLDRVNVQFIPPKAVGLLAQYASQLKKYNGTVIKLSSKNLLSDVHESHVGINDKALDDLYEQIVSEVGIPPQRKSKSFKDLKALRVLGFS